MKKMKYIENFHEARSKKIGSSDIVACLPHPDSTESLAGHGRTAVTVVQEKQKIIERAPAGFPAKIGHAVEPLTLAEWIEQNDSPEVASKFLRGYMICEMSNDGKGYPSAPATQNTDYLHHTRAETDISVSHADVINIKTREYFEAKSSQYWAAKRNDDPHKGYDTKIKGHQGIPLKNYVQVLYGAAVYQEEYGIQIDTGRLVLTYDMSQWNAWEIRIDRKWQERLLEIASYLKQCIDANKLPKKMVMNQSDIKTLYPKLNEDFRMISGDELQLAMESAAQGKEATRQIEAWTQRLEDSKNALAILLKDSQKLKGVVDGNIIDLAAWQGRAGYEKAVKIGEIKKHPEIYQAMKAAGLIEETEAIRFVKIKFDGEL